MAEKQDKNTIEKYSLNKNLPKTPQTLPIKQLMNLGNEKSKISNDETNEETKNAMKMFNKFYNNLEKEKDPASKKFNDNIQKIIDKQEKHVNRNKMTEILDSISFIKPIGQIKNETYGKVFDCFCFFVHCQIHKKCLISKTTQFLWLPFVIIPDNCCWTETLEKCILMLFSNNNPNKYADLKRNPPYNFIQMIDFNRVKAPHSNRLSQRFTYYVSINQKITKQNSFQCCRDTEDFLWLEIKSINEGSVFNIWGPELAIFCSLIENNKLIIDLISTFAREKRLYSLKESTAISDDLNDDYLLSLPQKISEFGFDQVFYFSSMDTPKNIEEEVLKLSRINENDIERLYDDFVEHCYPSFYMTIVSFLQYMMKNGFDTNDFNLLRLFNGFNYNKNNYLTFHEVLLGFVCMETVTKHTSLRVKFLFRYYDTKKRGGLFEKDIRKLASDILLSSNATTSPITEQDIDRKAQEISNILDVKDIRGKRVVEFKNFYNAICKLQLRGTSNLCRTGNQSIFTIINKRLTTRNVKKADRFLKFSSVVKPKFFHEACQRCQRRKYRLLPELLIINADCYNNNSEKINLNQTKLDNKILLESVSKETRYLQIDHPARILIMKIQNFNKSKNKGLGLMASPEERGRFFSLLEKLQKEVMPIINSESRVRSISSPCFVIGDIHGNLEDLMTLELTIWHQFPCTGINYLFLGDYVDRGRWGIECVVYLLSMKVLMPNSITLLRGNHEIRQMQKKYTYKRECFYKYETDFGESIWDLTNEIFDQLPLCAVVDDAIFCAHGGIPMNTIKLSDIEASIPNHLSKVELDSPVAWEILWSDPAYFEQFKATKNINKPGFFKEGYTMNTKRGTAHFFNEKAVKEFLLQNNLTQIIRAHEAEKEGFRILFDSLCITIFSCSKYCGNNNKCAVIFLDQQKIRVIQIDTTFNKPAS